MKYILAISMAAAILPAAAQDKAVFDGYESYYATRPDRLFRTPGVALTPYAIEGEDGVRQSWQGQVNGRVQRVELKDGQVRINGRRLPAQRIHIFPGESISDTDLGMGTTAFFTKGWVCLENTPSSASGTAVRHQMVYLIKPTAKGLEAWKLPSLFGRCAGVRQRGQTIVVDEARMRYAPGQDWPSGVTVKAYAIRGQAFVPANGGWSGTFTEPDNVYKFSVDQP
jgi:hypothetical protein